MNLKDLRHDAAANILALNNQPRHACSLETLSYFLQRSIRTLRRWEAAPDRVTEYAYRYLAGCLFAWPAARWNLKRRELEIYTSATQLHAAHRAHIELLPDLLDCWRRAHLPPPADQPAPGGLLSLYTRITTQTGTITSVPEAYASTTASNGSLWDACTATATKSPPD